MRWYQIKSWIGEFISLSHDAMHVHVGLVIFLALLWLFRRNPRHALIAWTLTLTITLLNEALDAYDWIMWTGSINWVESIKDTLNTMFWPTLAGLAERYRGRLERRHPDRNRAV
jgi:Na+/proline symporter